MKTFQVMMMMMISFLLATTYGEGDDVVWTYDGESVKPNIPYYISFMDPDYGMWICRANMGSKSSCPQRPIMFTNPNIAPTQIMFMLSSTTDTVVRESTKVKIKFVNLGNCGESGIWRVVQNRTTFEGEVVLNGLESSNDSIFTIQKTDQYYKFTFGEGEYPATLITLSNQPEGGKQRLIARKYSAEMEVNFYRNLPTI